METIYLIIPGLGNSDENHWQSLWEKKYNNFKRIQQVEWFSPVRTDWVKTIDLAISEVKNKRIILVAHSLGCLAVAHWAQQTQQSSIAGALLVAPPDVEVIKQIKNVHGFNDVPQKEFPFKTILVASSNDEYANIHVSEHYAQLWGSNFVNVGNKGHINSKSGFGEWDEGFEILSSLE